MSPCSNDIRHAAQILRSGGLVAFPTETVYGLGADATNADAVAKIFAAKGRPSTNPLIVHVADAATARRYATDWPLAASRLAERFWPGPLTLVLPKAAEIVPVVTASLGTVGLRVPDHPLALQLLNEFDGPVAAPSANRSNRVSPTTAEHVRKELGDAVDLVLDGGSCRVGIESTVLDLTTSPPTILRPGGVPREQIEAVIGPVAVASGGGAHSAPAKSPGQQETHYAPRTPAFRLRYQQSAFTPGPCAVMVVGRKHQVRQVRQVRLVEMPGIPDEYARLFYAVLRELDALGLPSLYVEMPPDGPEWDAVRDRIRRATKPL
jgi:L-threonylcarbamoyladenylate synthase